MRRVVVMASVLACAGAAMGEGVIPYPHPVITEILFEVPSSVLGGDANLDGVRHAIGDEFVELYNPHGRAIDLSGYTISDSFPHEQHRLSFTFPRGAKLDAGRCVVVFNGFQQEDGMPKPYGDRRTVAPGPHRDFHGALVYSIKNISGTRAWANDRDALVLRDPDGNVIEMVVWGEPESLPAQTPLRREDVEAAVPYSYQRLSADGELLSHLEIDGRRFSPGEIPEHTNGDHASE